METTEVNMPSNDTLPDAAPQHRRARLRGTMLPALRPRLLLVYAVRLYQLVLSPIMPQRCRHLPTCSDYAIEALREHGVLRGGWLAVRRIARCHPFGTSGFDPVPAREDVPRRSAS